MSQLGLFLKNLQTSFGIQGGHTCNFMKGLSIRQGYDCECSGLHFHVGSENSPTTISWHHYPLLAAWPRSPMIYSVLYTVYQRTLFSRYFVALLWYRWLIPPWNTPTCLGFLDRTLSLILSVSPRLLPHPLPLPLSFLFRVPFILNLLCRLSWNSHFISFSWDGNIPQPLF